MSLPTVSPRRAAHSYTYQARASLKQKNPSGCSASNKSLTAVSAVSLECGDFLALAVLAVGAHGDEHIAELACSGLRAQNHTAGVRGGGHLLTDETEDVRPACTQRTGQRIRLVAELGGDGAHIVRNFGLYAPLVASVEHQRYRRDGNPRLVRDFLHRNHASNDTP